MNFIYRIILKIHTTCQNFVKIANIKTAQKKGMKIGKNLYVERFANFGSEPFLIEIGNDVTLAEGVTFINHGGDARVTKRLEKYKDGRNFGRIKIGNNTFIGKATILMPGVSIGNNCIVGSMSIVTNSIADHSVYAGVPAKFMCTTEEYGDKLLANNVEYPRELEKDRGKLEDYLSQNLTHTYKPVK